MKKLAKNAITIFFLIVGIVATYVILKEYDIKDILSVYKNFNIWVLLLYAFVIFSIYFVLTWRWDVILRSRNIKIPFYKLYIYRIIGTSINFLTPGPRVGGEPTQANLLSKHGVEFTEGLSTIMIDKIIDTTTSGLLFILGVLLVGVKYSFPRGTEVILWVFGTIFVVLVVLFYYRMLTNRHFFLNLFRMLYLDRVSWLKKIEGSIEQIEIIMIEFYKHNKKAFLKSLAISIFIWVVMFFEYTFATRLLGFHLGVVEMFFIITFIGIAQLFPIPMAIGVLEAGQISAFALIGLPTAAGVSLAFLVRFKDITVAIIGLVLLAMYGFHMKDVVKVVEKKYRNEKKL